MPRFTVAPARTGEGELSTVYDWTKRFYGLLGAQNRFETGLRGLPQGQRVVQWFTDNF